MDSGYALCLGYLSPHPITRSSKSSKVVFNHHHAKLRNVIERTFGVSKKKWRILKGIPSYPSKRQSLIIVACCALHNFVREQTGIAKEQTSRGSSVSSRCQPGVSLWSYERAAGSPDMSKVHDCITYGLRRLQFRYVNL